MKRYIDADKLYDFMNRANIPYNALVEEAIDYQATADVVEVVRCKDCLYRPCLIMPHSSDFDFCSYGERAKE